MATKLQLEKDIKACQVKREAAEEKVIQLENDISNIRSDKLWNFLSYLVGVCFLVFIIIMKVDGTAVKVGFMKGTFDGNGLYLIAFLLMFGNRIINMVGAFFGVLKNFKVVNKS